jgi:hypothetical protein
MFVIGVIRGAAAGVGVRAACVVVCAAGWVAVVVHACVAARVRLTSATAAALGRGRRVNIYDAR